MKDECNLVRNAQGHLDVDYRLNILLTDLIRNSFNNGSSEVGWQHTEILLTGSISISIMRFFTPSSLCSMASPEFLLWNPCSTSGVGKNGLGCFSSITAAGVIIWETLVTGSSHQFQILGRIFNNVQRFHLEHLPAAGVRKIDSAVHRIGGEVILMSRAVAERREEDAQVNKTAAARALSIRNQM